MGQLSSLPPAHEAPEGRGHLRDWRRRLPAAPASHGSDAKPPPGRPLLEEVYFHPPTGISIGEGETRDKELQIREKCSPLPAGASVHVKNPRSRCLPKATQMGLLSSTRSQGGKSSWGLPIGGSTLRGPACRPQSAWVPRSPHWPAPRGAVTVGGAPPWPQLVGRPVVRTSSGPQHLLQERGGSLWSPHPGLTLHWL